MDEAEAVLKQAMALIDEQKERALKRVVRAHRALRAAQTEYEKAVLEAHGLRISSSKIAHAVGMTETAIRLFIKRRKKDQ